MDKIEKYRNLIQKLIKEYGQYGTNDDDDVKTEYIFDTVREHYQLVRVGWNGHQRIRGCPIHIDIINGKIWFQYNGTEMDFAEELVTLGVPKEDIVLAFHAPYKRQYTGYAVE
jgi:XisI protein